MYQGTDSKTLAQGCGPPQGHQHLGRKCLYRRTQPRRPRDDFGDLHTLEPGDTITWTTKLGKRTYEVISVSKVLETDTSGTPPPRTTA